MNRPRVDHDQLERILQTTISSAALTRTRLPLCPEIELWLLAPDYPRGPLPDHDMRTIMDSPAYWAFCWASGQAFARYILDHARTFSGMTVLDFGSGSGVVAIAAALAGAATVHACDIDEHARLASRVNATLNGVAIDTCRRLDESCGSVDVILAADVLYDRQNHRFLDEFRDLAPNVVIADSRVHASVLDGYELIDRKVIATVPDLDEYEEFNRVSIYRWQA